MPFGVCVAWVGAGALLVDMARTSGGPGELRADPAVRGRVDVVEALEQAGVKHTIRPCPSSPSSCPCERKMTGPAVPTDTTLYCTAKTASRI